MLQASELRIGNYLLFEGEIQELASIHSDDTIRLRKNKLEKCHGCYFIEKPNIEPIPLTDEWLLKFGFEIYGKDDIPNSPSDWIWGKIGFNISLTYETKKVQYANINLEYVHQLQNLYFALTGEELKLNIND